MRSDVILLPGLHGSTALFEAFIALRPAWARCHAIALPLDSKQSFDALAEAVVPPLHSLEGFVLIAESFSAPIAARISRLVGGKVALLVLCNPLSEASIAFPSQLGARLMQSQWLPAWAVAMAMAGGNRSLASVVIREVRSLPRHVLAARLASVNVATGTDLVSYVSAPLLGILGSRDRLISSSTSRAILAACPASTVVELPASHLVVQTHPAEVWSAISNEFENAA
jgi:pimeloyl-ACP methyl ester carboxylesterase